MNIALFPSAFHPHFGGVEELSRQLALELRRQGHGVWVFTNRWPRTLPRHEVFEGIPLYRLPFRTPDSGFKSRVTYHLSHGGVQRELLGLLQQHAIDMLHVQCVSSNAHYALAARQRLGLPLVVTLQGELTMDASHLFERSEFARATLRRCMAEAEMVTACSRKTLRDAEQFWGATLEDRGQVIFNGASLDDFVNAKPRQEAGPYIFAIGRLVPQKGFDVLLRAFAHARMTSHHLLLAGDGPEREPLQILARELGLNERVRFLGRSDRTSVASLFAGADFFVLPSRTDEGLPVVCAEAMAAGKAVIATRSGGAPEAVLDGETGLIIEKEDMEGLASAMQRLSADIDLRRRLAMAGRERAEEFAWPKITEQYLGCFETAQRKVNLNNLEPQRLTSTHAST